MRIWHFKLRIIRRYAAYLGHWTVLFGIRQKKHANIKKVRAKGNSRREHAERVKDTGNSHTCIGRQRLYITKFPEIK